MDEHYGWMTRRCDDIKPMIFFFFFFCAFFLNGQIKTAVEIANSADPDEVCLLV